MCSVAVQVLCLLFIDGCYTGDPKVIIVLKLVNDATYINH